MMQIVCCDFCGNQLSLDPKESKKGDVWSIHINFTAFNKQCNSCGHIDDTKYQGSFCSKKCLVKWLTKFPKGIPCRWCEGSGFHQNRKEWGKCSFCNGKKYIKV